MSTARKTVSQKTPASNYTQPALRERLKKQVIAGDRGGKPGQWSARKAQLLAQEYKAAGGGYKDGGKQPAQKHLDQWTAEHWKTSDGKKADRPGGTTRYLPKSAWDKLSPSEKNSTNRKKVAGSRHGKQFVANTPAAKTAGSRARHPD